MPLYLIISIRATLAYLSLLIMTRLMGKREISQLTFFDYVVGISIGTVAGSLAIDTTKAFTNILPALIVFGLLQILTSYLSLKSKGFRKISGGSPTVLIRNGKIIENNLLKSRLNMDELSAKLRDKNIFKLVDVEFAILETDGKVSVMKKPNKQSLTPSDLGLATVYSGIGVFIIEDGEIIEDKLRQCGLTRSWLLSKLAEQKVFDISKVMFAQVDATGKLYIDLYDTYVQNIDSSRSNKILLAKLQKIHSDLLSYSAESENENIKQLYKDSANKMKKIEIEFDTFLSNEKIKNTVLNRRK